MAKAGGRMMTGKMRQDMRASIAGIGWLLALAGAAAGEPGAVNADPPFPSIRWTAEQAVDAGWKRADIDLGAPGLSYVTYVPNDASIETAPLDGNIPAGPGRVKVVAKYKLPFSFGEIEGTVTAFQLRGTGSAAHLCGEILENDGLKPRVYDVDLDKTHAQFLSSASAENDNPARGGFTDCRTRGHALLLHHFAFPLAPATETHDLDARVDAALQVALPIVSNLAFRDGRPDGYGDAAEPVELKIGATPRTLPVPKDLAVAFNDFDGRSGARELYLLEQREGATPAMVWLGVREMTERPDLAKVGPQLVARQFRLQSEDMSEPKLVFNETIEPSQDGSATGQAFRFSIADSRGRDAGILEGEAYWSRGRLFVVTRYSNFGKDDGSFDAIIVRLPSQTAYDLVRTAVRLEQ